MQILAILLLCSPLLIVLITALFYFIPGLSDYVSKVFWAVLGDKIPIFSMASTVLEEYAGYDQLDITNLGLAYLKVIVGGIYDAMFFGCCLFFLQSLFFVLQKVKGKNDKYYLFRLSRPKVFYNVIGIFIGVCIRPLLNLGTGLLSSVLQAAVPILMLGYGVKRIWTAGNGIRGKNNARKTLGSRESFLLSLLLNILINACKAVAAISLITFVMESPRLLHEGKYLVPLLIWCIGCLVLLAICEMLSGKNDKDTYGK